MHQREETVSISPVTGEVLGQSPLNTVADLAELVTRARSVQPAWAETPIGHRARAMRRVRDYLVEHADELAGIISRENGKTRLDALVTEVLAAAMAVTYYARHAKGVSRGRACARGVSSWPTSGAGSGTSLGE